METWIAIIGGIFTTFLSGFSSWFFTKKKYNAEVDNNLISNMQQSLDFYKTLADDNSKRLEEVLSENADLRAQVGDLRKQVEQLTTALAQYGIKRLITDNEREN